MVVYRPLSGYITTMIHRHISQRLLDALGDTPVVLLHGARQTGKTTLVRAIAEDKHPALYFTFDDPAVLGAAKSDPQGFIERIDGPVVLDEVQRVPELALAIKLAVDRRREPGRFLLTGSANVLHVPNLSDSLAGRMKSNRYGRSRRGRLGAFASPSSMCCSPSGFQNSARKRTGRL